MSEQQTGEVRVRDDLGHASAAAAAIAPDAPEAEPAIEPDAEPETVPSPRDSSALDAARAAVIAACERIGEAARSTDLEFAHNQLGELRSLAATVDPRALTPRRGLGGLFDSPRKRLRRFREHVIDSAPAVSTAAVKLRDASAGLTRRNETLNEGRQALLDRLGELDAALAAFAEADIALADDRPLTELMDRLDSEMRAPAQAADSLRAGALGHLPLTRMVQNVDARLADAIGGAAEAAGQWRDGMLQALGAEGKKLAPLRKVRPDPVALQATCETLMTALDRLEPVFDAARARRNDVLARMDQALGRLRAA